MPEVHRGDLHTMPTTTAPSPPTRPKERSAASTAATRCQVGVPPPSRAATQISMDPARVATAAPHHATQAPASRAEGEREEGRLAAGGRGRSPSRKPASIPLNKGPKYISPPRPSPVAAGRQQPQGTREGEGQVGKAAAEGVRVSPPRSPRGDDARRKDRKFNFLIIGI
jgi:hypothetical protein